MSILFFATPDDFRRWLADHHDSEDELWVGYYKKATGKPSITWPESVDEALCFGWIDGVRKSVDEEAYKIRFTPRRRGSNWSRINLERVSALIDQGRMTPAGLAAYEARDPEKAGYSFEQDEPRFTQSRRRCSRLAPRRGSSGARSRPVTANRQPGGSRAPRRRLPATVGSPRSSRTPPTV